ncbi:hypothetical protein HDE_01664 [Halotydeus destructor]|nr:hypothetical protein HDE_01664 [Halotydeus destructor]
MPILSVCYYYPDIIVDTDDEAYLSVDIRQLITLQGLFNMSASTKDMFETCSMRYTGDPGWIEYYGRECNAIFEVTRFFTQEYLCYKVAPRANISTDYNYENVASTMWASGMTYEVGFNNSRFDSSYLTVPVIHQLSEVLPAVSIYFAPQIIRRDRTRNDIGGTNYFLMTYSSIGNYMKPPPYDTNCSDYEEPGLFIKSRQGCYSQCLINHTLTGLNKFPYSVITSEDLDYNFDRRHITYKDIEDEKVQSKLSEYEKLCDSICLMPNCREVFTLTELRFSDNRADSIFYRMEIPRSPNFDIYHYTKVPLNAFILYILSCFGTWLGINAISLNPVHAYNFVKTVRNKRNKVNTLPTSHYRLERLIKEGNYSTVIKKFTINVRMAQIENELLAQQIKYLYSLAKRKS